MATAALVSAGCQHTATIMTGVLELPNAAAGIGRMVDASRDPGSPRTPSDEEVAVLEVEHEKRMRPLQTVSAGLLAGEAYWVRGTARFLVVVRSESAQRAVLGLEVAETAAGSRVHVICAAASDCPKDSVRLKVETMRWLRKNQLESAEPVPAVPLSEAELTWQAPYVGLVSHGEVATLRSLPAGADPYAVALSPDGALALLRVRGAAGEQATVVRIPDRAPPL